MCIFELKSLFISCEFSILNVITFYAFLRLLKNTPVRWKTLSAHFLYNRTRVDKCALCDKLHTSGGVSKKKLRIGLSEQSQNSCLFYQDEVCFETRLPRDYSCSDIWLMVSAHYSSTCCSV